MITLCPHCGYDLRQDTIITLDGFHIDPRGTIEYSGHVLDLWAAWFIILATLAKAHPRMVGKWVLVERLDLDGDDPIANLRSLISDLRDMLRRISLPQPIRTVHGMGYIWDLVDAGSRRSYVMPSRSG